MPKSGQELFSFIGLVTFYNRYITYHEVRIKPLRRLLKTYFRQPIPIMVWSPDLLTLFYDFKKAITSSPVLSRFDPSKPVFLKIDWSSVGVGFVVMQPANEEISEKATALLQTTGEWLFDISLEGPRVQPLSFGSRTCTDIEKNFHYFVGEASAGRWSIAKNRHYLWGSHFYWICDCKSIKHVLDYSGSITLVRGGLKSC